MRPVAGLCFALGLGLAGLAAGRDAVDLWVDTTQIPAVLAETSVEVFDRSGQLLRAFPVEDGRWRLPVALAQVDPGFVDMLVRYEDKRFWQHAGVDPMALIRAGTQAVLHRRVISGGSTLTMQLARLLENGSTGQVPGKIRQIRLALALERRLTKREILSLYLLHAPYGGNLEGLRSATRAWFGKDPRRLSAAEAAMLIALPQAPETRRPDRHPDAAMAARNRVLSRLADQGLLSAPDAKQGRADPIPTRRIAMPSHAPHLAEEVRRRYPLRRRHDLSIDLQIQAKLERDLAHALRAAPNGVSGAIVVADHQTGALIAVVGSPAFTGQDNAGFVDMTRAVRSPGSTLKPLIYGLAFDQGIAHPGTIIHDGPVQFGRYAPQNFDGVFRGDVTVRAALQASLNIPVVKLTHALGPARVMAALRSVGVTAHVPDGRAGLAISLGGLGVSLRDLTQLYAALARGGKGIPLTDGTDQPSATARLMSPAAAWHLGQILSELAPPPGAPHNTVAYKTGTSYGHRDSWAIGWDGQHVAGVWVGRPDGTPVPGAFGFDVAAPILFTTLGRVKPEFAPLAPPPPETLLLGSADLPGPLKRFRSPDGKLRRIAPKPDVIYPPDGAQILLSQGPLFIKVRGGARPYTILQNGSPVTVGAHSAQIEIPNPGPGFSTLTVLDAKGHAREVAIRVLD